MDHAITDTPAETILHGALELSKNSWLLALQFPDRAQPSSVSDQRRGYGRADGETHSSPRSLGQDERQGAVDRDLLRGRIRRLLAGTVSQARGIECLVVDAASMQVNRRARRAKTDRIDVGMLLRALMAWGQGDRHVWSVVRVPNVDEEDLRRSHRERDRLVKRTAHINRIKGLLFGQGIRGINVKSKYKTLQIDKLVTGDGRPLPPRLVSEITREIARLALIQEQIATLERERDQAPTPCKATEKKRLQLMSLNGIGPAIAAVMTHEVYYRQFDNRRQVAGLLGLATSPHDSGDVEHPRDLRAGRGQVRGTMIQAAWLWLKHQPKSAITWWFVQRTAG